MKSTEIGYIPTEWNYINIEPFIKNIIDYRGKTPKKSKSGIPLVTAKMVKNGFISFDNNEFLSISNYEKWMRRGMPKEGDVVITTEAPLGEIAQLDKRKIALAQRIVLLRTKKDKLDNNYLKYFLMSPIGQFELHSRSTGSTALGIRQSEIMKINVLIPNSIVEQKAISILLSTIEKKIKINFELNYFLEQLANKLFNEKYTCYYRSFRDNKSTSLPENWKVAKLSELIVINDKYINPLNYPEEIFYHYSIPTLDLDNLPDKELGEYIKSRKALIEDECILISRINPEKHKRIYFPLIKEEFKSIASTEFFIFSGKRNIPNEFLYLLLNDRKFYSEFTLLIEGSTGSRQRVRVQDFLNLKVLLPNDAFFSYIFKNMKPIFDKIKSNINENESLLILRDILIPQILSGRLRFSKPEKYLEKMNNENI